MNLLRPTHLVRCYLSCFLLLTFATVSPAAVIRYEATGAFTRSDFPVEIAVGDRFSISFAYNDAVADTNANILAGRFPGALVYFDFRLIPGGIGTYSGGSATLFYPIDTFDGVGEGNAAIPDRFYISAAGGDFAPLNGHPFGSVLFVLDDYSHSTSIRDFGAGQTLRSLLGGNLELQQFKSTLVRVSATGKNGMAEGNIATLAVQSDPVLRVSQESMNKLRIGWTTNHSNYLLESTTSLTAPNWQAANDLPVLEGSDLSLRVDAEAGTRFFRLRSR